MDRAPEWVFNILYWLGGIFTAVIVNWINGRIKTKQDHARDAENLRPNVQVRGQGDTRSDVKVGQEIFSSYNFNGTFRVVSGSKPAKPLFHSFSVTCAPHGKTFETVWAPFHPDELLNLGGATNFSNSITTDVHDEDGCSFNVTGRVRYTDSQELGFYEQTDKDRVKILKKDSRKVSLWVRVRAFIFWLWRSDRSEDQV